MLLSKSDTAIVGSVSLYPATTPSKLPFHFFLKPISHALKFKAWHRLKKLHCSAGTTLCFDQTFIFQQPNFF